MSNQVKPKLIGIAGGSGSGKTTFARALVAALPDHCALIYQDNYYFDQSGKFDFDGGSVNFDHPDALDFDLLARHLADLKQGRGVDVPIYDFATHTRSARTLRIEPKPLILVDGILIFHPPKVCELFDERLFFHASEALRYERRLSRDVAERGRTPEGVRAQFLRHVKPMHDQFVEPSKTRAHQVIDDQAGFEQALDAFLDRYGGRRA